MTTTALYASVVHVDGWVTLIVRDADHNQVGVARAGLPGNNDRGAWDRELEGLGLRKAGDWTSVSGGLGTVAVVTR